MVEQVHGDHAAGPFAWCALLDRDLRVDRDVLAESDAHDAFADHFLASGRSDQAAPVLDVGVCDDDWVAHRLP
jgi:hypothetical protein